MNSEWRPGTHLIDQASIWCPTPLYDWQIDILNACEEEHSRVVSSMPNEAGKTSVVGVCFIFGMMYAFPGARCYATSGSERQIKQQFFEQHVLAVVRPLVQHGWKISMGDMKVTAPNGSTLLCYVCKESEKVEGFHGGVNKQTGLYEPCVYFVDEGKSVQDENRKGIIRIDPDFQLNVSSPGETSGWFYNGLGPENLRSVIEDRRRKGGKFLDRNWLNYKPDELHRFPGDLFTYRRSVTLEECPHLMQHAKLRERKNIEREYGKSSSFVQSFVYGRYVRTTDEKIVFSDFDLHLAEQSMSRHADFNKAIQGEPKAAADVSGGGDAAVLMIRKGTSLLLIDEKTGMDELAVADYWVNTLRRLAIPPSRFTLDGGGIGSTVAKYMRRLRFSPIRLFMYNNRPTFKFQFADRYTELHWLVQDLLRSRMLQLPPCKQLLADMRARRYVDREGKIKMEPKEDHRARERRSPDFLDTIVYLFSDFNPALLDLGAETCPRAENEDVLDHAPEDDIKRWPEDQPEQTPGFMGGLTDVPQTFRLDE